MSDRKDEDEKITVLFPQDDSGQRDSDGDGGQAGDAELAEVEGDGGEDSAAQQDNVVTLDFDRRSPTQKVPPESEQARAKLDAFSTYIETGMVMVTLDARVEGVEVPPKFAGLPELRLNFSHQFYIDDFDYDGRGVRASLSFQGTRHFCDIPWTAVQMIYSHESGELAVFDVDGDDG